MPSTGSGARALFGSDWRQCTLTTRLVKHRHLASAKEMLRIGVTEALSRGLRVTSWLLSDFAAHSFLRLSVNTGSPTALKHWSSRNARLSKFCRGDGGSVRVVPSTPALMDAPCRRVSRAESRCVPRGASRPRPVVRAKALSYCWSASGGGAIMSFRSSVPGATEADPRSGTRRRHIADGLKAAG
jgi:hypothetical protein